jgi:hypothetical protein
MLLSKGIEMRSRRKVEISTKQWGSAWLNIAADQGDSPGAGDELAELQEALTNVLRHAQPLVCTIEMNVTDGCAHLGVINDKVPAVDGGRRGAGLAALSRYLDRHAGQLIAGPCPDGTYRLDALVPEAPR